jgi:prophage regulatory protein
MLDAAVRELTAKTVSELLGVDKKPGTALLTGSLREMLLRIDTVCAITGLSTPTIYRAMAKGGFPRPVKITSYARAWKLSEIMQWIDSRDRDLSDDATAEEHGK